MDQKEQKTIVKVPLEPDKAAALNALAKERGRTRADYCREVLIRHLAGHEAGKDTGTASGTKDQGSDPAGYLRKITALEDEVTRLKLEVEERKRDKEIMHHELSAALSKIPQALPKTIEEKPGWWSRLMERWKGTG